MLDGLLGRGFYSKCKSSVKLTRTRIDVIRRKRKATQRFLKKDIADLIVNGLDINAYGRAEGLFVELTLTSCYDFVDKSCEFILKHLSVMQKHRECPEECKEAVSSLMFAAARFADLPELRDLRHIFQERYENSLEYFANKEFVEKLSSKPPTMEKKVQLMQDIASEFSIKWDSGAFERRMSNPSPSLQGTPKKYVANGKHKPFDAEENTVQRKHEIFSASLQSTPRGYGSLHVTNDAYKSFNADENTVLKRDKHEIFSKERIAPTYDGHTLGNEKSIVSRRDELDNQFIRKHFTSNDFKPQNGWKESMEKRDGNDIPNQEWQQVTSDRHETWNTKSEAALKAARLSGCTSHAGRLECVDGYGREFSTPKREIHERIQNGKQGLPPRHERVMKAKSDGKYTPLTGSNCNGCEFTMTGTDSRAERLQGKSEVEDDHISDNKYNGQHNLLNSIENLEEETEGFKPYYHNAIPPPYVKPKDKKNGAKLGSEQAGCVSHNLEGAHRGHGAYEDGQAKGNHYDDVMINSPLPKTRSHRRRHSKSSSSNYDNNGNLDESVVVVKRKSTGRRREESRKGLQTLFDDYQCERDEEERIIDKLLMHYSKKPSTCEPGKVRRKPSKAYLYPSAIDSHAISEMVPPPSRSVSLPREQRGSSGPTKVFNRAASFQPDKAVHVHPKLPDYEDLAARFATLRGR